MVSMVRLTIKKPALKIIGLTKPLNCNGRVYKISLWDNKMSIKTQ
ncbi:Uncharacterised protein [Yersinia pekkanenii]|uniref:Uncharacterized protein n=1 Tax=Yersinia pekkanenii TaxID=1288385 RepID=A0A0T9P166_9GAMM|nr:Uncharacterised protein [Yersinia pekkanenii]CRY66922.1 Uncharacterised protein [Yersinia pekkanenii]